MQDRKLKVAFTFFPYGGNGGTSSETPDIRNWIVPTIIKASKDPRISEVISQDFSDTPITMTRNRAVEWARANRVDALVMVDSDMKPDCELGRDKLAKPWWDTSFDFLYRHYDRGPCVVGAPYCGPPPHENVYVFKIVSDETSAASVAWRLAQYDRSEAEIMGGIQNCAALPTGGILFDTRVFDVLERPYFYYEFAGDGETCGSCGQRSRGPESSKDSTEDVVHTRNIAFNAQLKLGYNPLYCNWDAWWGHWKPKCVGKPRMPRFDSIERTYREAVLRGVSSGEQLVELPAVKSRPHLAICG